MPVQALREATILSSLKHENIIEVKDMIIDETKI